MSDAKIEALRRAVAAAPDDDALRQMLAEALGEAGRAEEALDQWRELAARDGISDAAVLDAGRLALEAGELDLTATCLEIARSRGLVEGVAALQRSFDEKRAGRGVLRLVRREGEGAAETVTDLQDGRASVTFADVGGLDEVKRVIHRKIILPLQKPGLLARFKRTAGGGVLLYGPPGCGKTLLARATAGECGLPFLNVRIEEVLDPWFGVSEKRLHDAFEQARAKSPCVLFLDELDALAFSRRRARGGPGRTLVDQLLQELDAIGAENAGVLVLAATNAPWDVDDAVLRPGRFDRTIFIPPPDAPARRRVLEILLADRPVSGVDLDRLAQGAHLFSGADLLALIERGIDRAIEDAIATGGEPPLTGAHLEAARAELKPSTLEWLQHARGFVEFANQTERWSDVETFLRSPEVKRFKF